MTAASDAVRDALTRLANDRRRTAAHYANVSARPGSSTVPARLLSDVGFLTALQFSYVNAHPSHVVPGDPDTPRALARVVCTPYGLAQDLAVLTSGQARDRVVRSGPGRGGVWAYAQDVLVSGSVGQDTVQPAKTARAVRSMTQAGNGVAYHTLIDRAGNITIGPNFDASVTAVTNAQDAIVVGLEGCAGVRRADHAARAPNAVFELPYTPAQLTTLAVLIAKVRAVAPSVPATRAGLPYVITELPALNFSDGGWSGAVFDYTATDITQELALVTQQGAFDPAADVYRPRGPVRPVAAREAVRTAIGTVDTLGETSVLLGGYVSVAAPERSYEMQSLGRREMFVQRERASHTDADDAGGEASHQEQAATALATPAPTVTGHEPHTFDYTTGLWGDGRAY